MKLPKLTNLTEEQKYVIDSDGNFAVFGGAGTGKTMISIWRHIRNFESGKKSYLITFTHTLTYFLELLISQENQEAKYFINNANAFIKDLDKFTEIDELIIDEAQDLDLETHNKLVKKFKVVSYGVDNRQHIYQNGATQKELNNIYNPRVQQELFLNFRNSANILSLIQALFPNNGITEKMINYSKNNYLGNHQLPILIQSNNNQRLKDIFCKTINNLSINESIAILVPTVKLMSEYRLILDSCQIKYSSYNYQDLGNVRHIGISRIHLTTFHSSKGLEFDNVIIPEFQLFSQSNKYYVGLTRAKTGLYLFSNSVNPISTISKILYNIQEV